MIFPSRMVTSGDLERATEWKIDRRGLCRGDVCVPFDRREGPFDLRDIAKALHMPLIEDSGTGFVALGPASGGRALSSAAAPDLRLPHRDGRPFRLSSLRGQKVLVVVWAPW